MFLAEKLKAQISDLAERATPNECCGFVLTKDGEAFLFPCKSKFPGQFQIDPVEFLEAKRKGKIEAVYHSHPNGRAEFSEIDKLSSLHHGIKYILYVPNSKQFKEFGYDAKYYKYVGKMFEIGVEDCFSLAKNFYKNELGIDITNYERAEGWLNGERSLFDLHYEKEGFSKTTTKQKYDLITFNSSSRKGFSSHIAIYLGDGLVLHNRRESFSKVEEYSEAYEKLTHYILRHKSLL